MTLSKTQRFGLRSEVVVADLLEKQGYTVYMPPDFNKTYDLLVDGILPVHVVATVKRYRHNGRKRYPYWRLTCSRINFSEPSLVVALAWLVPSFLLSPDAVYVPFFIPSAAFGSRRFLSITSNPQHYRGWAAGYRWGVDQVEAVKQTIDSFQLPLEVMFRSVDHAQ